MTTNLFARKADGSRDYANPIEVESKDAPLPHHTAGLSYTTSGYGKRIPTRMLVRFNGKWRRVYCCVYSNAGTCYIGKWVTGKGAELTVSEV